MNHKLKNFHGKRSLEIICAKKIWKKIRNSRGSQHPGQNQSGTSLAVGIAGPFLDNPFRLLTTVASTGLPGRGRAPVLLSFFIIQIEIFWLLRFFRRFFCRPWGLFLVGITIRAAVVPWSLSPGALDVLRILFWLSFFCHSYPDRSFGTGTQISCPIARQD